MKIAIIGGTGVYDISFIEKPNEITVNTPYGKITMLKCFRSNNEIYFLERHAKGHKLTPSKVNYKGNIYALKKLGIDFILSTAAVGAINNCKLGDFVVLDQFIDFTKNRDCTFFNEEDAGLIHIDMTEPYCSTIRNLLIKSLEDLKIPHVKSGTYVCTEGPRFETPAEISMYKKLGADVVGMTNVPEVVLARECALCYATLALVTNYAAGISKTPLTQKEVNDNMSEMSKNLEKCITYFIDNINNERQCSCKNALDELNTLK